MIPKTFDDWILKLKNINNKLEWELMDQHVYDDLRDAYDTLTLKGVKRC